MSEHLGAISAPHDVRGCRDDFAVMFLGLSLNNPVGREQMLLPHNAQHPFPADLDSLNKTEARPHLAMPFADERGAGQIIANEREQLLVAEQRPRAAL